MTKYICTLLILALAVLSACEQKITNAYEKEYTLELSRDTLVFNVGVGMKSVEIKTNQDWWEYTNNDDEDWYLVKDFHDADGYNMLTISVDSCAELSNRKSSLTINAGNQYTAKLFIIQLGNEPYIHIADSLITTDKDTAVLDINYVSNMEFDISDVPSWVKIEKTEINNEEVLRMLVSRNETGAERSAQINLSQKDGNYSRILTLIQLSDFSDYEPSDAQSVKGNKQIPIISASASSVALDSDINSAFDGNLDTYFQTNWQETEPLELNFVINPGDDLLNYIIYYPSQALAANAQSIKVAQVMVRKAGEENFTNVRMATFSKDAPTVITPTSPLANIEEVKFKVMMTHAETGSIPAVSCAEIEFYTTSTLYPNIFTDLTCSEILPTVSMEEILNIDDSFYRNIAKHIYNGTYQSERILDLEAIQQDRIKSKINNASLFEHATGIYFNTEDEHVIFCGEFTGTAPSVMILNQSGLVSYSLIEGINKIATNTGGRVYINNPRGVKIHVAGGVAQKSIEIGEINTISEISFEENEVIDIYSQNAHIITPIAFAKENIENLSLFDEKISSVIAQAKAFYGVNEGAYKVESKLGFYIGEEPLGLETLVNLSGSEMLTLCNFEDEYNDVVLSVFERVGNAYEPYLNKFWGVNGASSKLFALAYLYENNNISVVKDKELYSSAIQEIIVANYNYLEAENEWSKVVPLWQIYHYLKNAEGINDYYAQVCNLVKQKSTTSSYTNELLTYTKQITGINFDDFFYKWNMGGKQSTEPVTGALPYYVEDNLSAFQAMAPLSPGRLFTSTGLLYSYQNVVAIEIYNAGFLAHVETNISGNRHILDKNKYSKNMKVRVIGATGESQEPLYM